MHQLITIGRRNTNFQLMLAFIVLLLVTAPTSGQTPSPTPASGQLVKLEYDSAKDITQISLNPIVLATSKLEELRLGAITGYKGKVKTTPPDLILLFLSLTKTDEDKYASARKLAITADGQRFELGETSHTKQSQSGIFLETMAINVKMNDFVQISNARQVKIKLGITEVDLTPEQIKVLRFTASYLTE